MSSFTVEYYSDAATGWEPFAKAETLERAHERAKEAKENFNRVRIIEVHEVPTGLSLADLKHGRRYRLTRDVTNPNRDKRATDDPTRLPWSAGDIWRVERRERSRDDVNFIEMRCVQCKGAKRGPTSYIPMNIGYVKRDGSGTKLRDDVCPQAFLDALELLPEDFADVMMQVWDAPTGDQRERCALLTLEWMFNAREVDRDALQRARDAVHKEWEKEAEEEEAKVKETPRG